jgi:hypothetical protein
VRDPFSTFLNHLHNRITDGGEFSGLQLSGLPVNEAGVSGEKLAGANLTGQAE